MTQQLQQLLKTTNEYLTDFAKNGYCREKANDILRLTEDGCDAPFFRMLRTFGCDRFDAAMLLGGLLVSVSDRAADTAAALFGAPKGCITPAFAAAVFFGLEDILPFTASLQPYAPLSRLMDGVQCRSGAALRIKDCMADYAVSGVIWDDAFCTPDASGEILPLTAQKKAEEEIISFLRQDTAEPFVLQLTGEAGSGRHTVAKSALAAVGLPCICVHFDREPDGERLRELAAKLLLCGAVPVVSADFTEALSEITGRLAQEVGFVIVIAPQCPEKPSERTDTVHIALPNPTLAEQYRLWRQESESCTLAGGADLSELSGEFDMTPGAVKKALRYARVLGGDKPLTLSDVKRGCYRSFGADMGDKATKLQSAYSWDDMVLPKQSLRLLREACSQVRLRHKVLHGWGFSEKMPYGTGVSMLFTGPPGTGKTMAARILAGELGMDIYRISLANVVSKYIGETEKNLNEIFDKAKLCRGILFFDEADVLFSKRTEVREANDKYSNMESAFLLQKIEDFGGVVILATNLVQNFDEAFKRRMRFLIDFPFPGKAQRKSLWQKAFPDGAPLGDIDMDFLVEHFALSGSNIRNIALHSAFLAAQENAASIGMKQIMEAIRNEYAKIGKAFTRAEAGEYYCDLGIQGE